MPVDASVFTRFIEAFISANCVSINTLCLCRMTEDSSLDIEIDFTGIS